MKEIPLLTAVTDPAWEANFLTELDSRELGVRVVRRCLDLADLLAAATTGTARAALVSAGLARLDAEAVFQLIQNGVAPLALLPVDAGEAAARLNRLGIQVVVTAQAGPAAAAAAVHEAVAGYRATNSAAALDGDSAASGRIVAVWGPTGAPGRSTVAANMAGELAALGREVLLVDIDVYGGSLAQLLGVLDEAPGVAAAARAANGGTLDLSALAALSLQLRPGLRLLTGISRAERWPELRPAALEKVLAVCRSLAATTVLDCGFCLEQDESFDAQTLRRNSATLLALKDADAVVAVAAADPIGVHRFIRAMDDLRACVSGQPVAVLNKVRGSVAGPHAPAALTEAITLHAGLGSVKLLPWDPESCDAAVLSGRLLGEVAPGSGLRRAIRALAAEVEGLPVPRPRRPWRRPQRAAATRRRHEVA